VLSGGVVTLVGDDAKAPAAAAAAAPKAAPKAADAAPAKKSGGRQLFLYL